MCRSDEARKSIDICGADLLKDIEMRRGGDSLDIIGFDLGEHGLDCRGIALEIRQVPTDNSQVCTRLGRENTDAETKCQEGMKTIRSGEWGQWGNLRFSQR